MTRPRMRKGFTLMEVLVASFAVAVLASMTVPSLMGFLDNQRVVATANILSGIQTAITGATGFATKLAIDPGKLSELTQPIIATNGTYRNACGTSGAAAPNEFSSGNVTTWNTNGPFYNAVATQGTGDNGGITTPMGTIADSIARSPTSIPAGTNSAMNVLQLRLLAVTEEDAKLLDLYIDQTANSGSGQVLWGTTSGGVFTAGNVAADGTVEVRYQISVFVTKC
jgi:prepilin-type N-terminal cleavage/methylation domain-containing protein